MTRDGERGRELFDPAPVFAADDYLWFYGFDEARDAADAADALRALDAPAGAALLDLACGDGRITDLLAERGYRMTGLDRDARFLELAREDAARRGVAVDYVKGDMRSLPWTEAFDGILCWFTAFGYFDEETLHRDNLMGRLLPSTVVERDGDLMLDLHRFDVEAGVMHTDRRIFHDGGVRRAPFAVRLFTYTELAEWLREAGCASFLGTDGDGSPLTLGSRRMNVVARCRRRSPPRWRRPRATPPGAPSIQPAATTCATSRSPRSTRPGAWTSTRRCTSSATATATASATRSPTSTRSSHPVGRWTGRRTSGVRPCTRRTGTRACTHRRSPRAQAASSRTSAGPR